MKTFLSRLLGHIPALLVSLAIVSAAGPAGAVETITYYHNDIAGSPILATDAAGAVLWKENYRPYGDKLNNPPAGADNKLGFTGKPYDANTGLSYMGARYYDPVIGRFTGTDPLDYDEKNLHSFNRYTYGNNNPYKFVDPDGRAAETVLDVISLALSIAAYKQDPSVINALGVGYDAVATAVPFLPAGFGILKSAGKTADALNGANNVAKETKLLSSPATGAKEVLQTPEKIIVDSRGNAIPLNRGEYLTGSKDARWVQVRDANGNATGMRIDGAHGPKTHNDPRALQPHAHVPGVANADGTPWLPIR